MSDAAATSQAIVPATPRPRRRRNSSPATTILARGEPSVWVTGGALALAITMILGLLSLVVWAGSSTFWPVAVHRIEFDGAPAIMGELFRSEDFRPSQDIVGSLPPGSRARAAALLQATDGVANRRLIRTANYDLTGTHFTWISEYERATPKFIAIEHEGEIWIFAADSPHLVAYRDDASLPTSFVAMEFPKHNVRVRVADELTWRSFLNDDTGESKPKWAITIERLAWGRFYGFPSALRIDDEVVAHTPEETWARFREHHADVRGKWHARRDLEVHAIGRVNRKLEAARLRLRQSQLREKPPVAWVSAYAELETVRRGGMPEEIEAAAAMADVQASVGQPNDAFMRAVARYEQETARGNEEFLDVMSRIAELNRAMARYEIVLESVNGETKSMSLAEIVRAYPANQLGIGAKLGVYLSRWWEFLTAEPREANMEGGVMPAIFGTVTMTMFMTIAVVPFGVLAALYLREYAKAGPMISAVRIAINNLAGVPSIVFGVFGLGFFCYIIGAGIDQVFYESKLPNPTFGKGGLLWASLTLALLTLPVVIVATEEALAAVPRSMREGSYACGASKWQTIRRIVLPRAMPGIMTGAILAMARGAGEVAPLMLVGAVKLAPELPIDGVAPFIHPERSFMHLGVHIYDLGFQSQNSEAAKPMVFTTTLLLIVIIALLNCAAIWLRSRLRRRFITSQF